MKKGILLLLTLAVIVSLFSACGKNALKNEEEIRADVRSHDSVFMQGNPDFDSFTITDRPTDRKNGTDPVFVSFTVKTDEFAYDANANLNYVLTEDGWLFDSYQSNGETVTPLIECTEEIAEQELKKFDLKKDKLLNTEQISDTSIAYLFRGEKPYHTYFEEQSEVSVICNFTVSSLWAAASSQEMPDSHVFSLSEDMLGQWQAVQPETEGTKNTSGTVTIEFLSIDGDIITFSYEIDVSVVGWHYLNDEEHIQSAGTQTCQIKENISLSNTEYFTLEFDDGDFNYAVTIDKDAGVSSIGMTATGEDFGSCTFGAEYGHEFRKIS